MKIYISIPISGRPLEKAKEHAQWLKDALTEHGHECVTPFDICPDQGKPYAYYMGKDIEALIGGKFDAVVFGQGYTKSKGCRLEMAAAKIFKKHITFETCFGFLDFETLTPNPYYNEKKKVSH